MISITTITHQALPTVDEHELLAGFPALLFAHDFGDGNWNWLDKVVLRAMLNL